MTLIQIKDGLLMHIFLQITGWLGMAIMCFAMPMIYQVRFEDALRWYLGLPVGTLIFIIGAFLLLFSGFFSRWRYWFAVSIVLGAALIIVAIPSLLHKQTLSAVDYKFRYFNWLTVLIPAVTCIIWGVFEYVRKFITKPKLFWLGYIITGVVLLTPLIISLVIWNPGEPKSIEILLFTSIVASIWYSPALILIIEGIILKLRDKKQHELVKS
jgi:peptidoglycan/LPS O-acetylase OafA/YrhL